MQQAVNRMQQDATGRNRMQQDATGRNKMQHAATCCNRMQQDADLRQRLQQAQHRCKHHVSVTHPGQRRHKVAASPRRLHRPFHHKRAGPEPAHRPDGGGASDVDSGDEEPRPAGPVLRFGGTGRADALAVGRDAGGHGAAGRNDHVWRGGDGGGGGEDESALDNAGLDPARRVPHEPARRVPHEPARRVPHDPARRVPHEPARPVELCPLLRSLRCGLHPAPSTQPGPRTRHEPARTSEDLPHLRLLHPARPAVRLRHPVPVHAARPDPSCGPLRRISGAGRAGTPDGSKVRRAIRVRARLVAARRRREWAGGR
jgi:hypothetical protein